MGSFLTLVFFGDALDDFFLGRFLLLLLELLIGEIRSEFEHIRSRLWAILLE